MSSAESEASLPYHEPGIATILIISSFLLSLNVVNYILDKIVYCGLVGQLFIGVAWGIPGADWLSHELQRSIVQLGYIGLVLIVYEGGISSNLKALKANLLLSSAVALTGIMAPIGLSFVLLGLLPLSPVNAFAAGAALCSTSLGTTFTVLATSGLTESRLGVVLTSAAMMDDIVGLIMVQIISSLSGGSSFSAVTVIRPVFVSIAFAIVVPLVCTFIAKPVVLATNDRLRQPQNTRFRAILYCSKATWIYQTALLLAMVTGATYAGTSNLFAAYLAGAAVTWLCDCVSSHEQGQSSAVDRAASNNSRPAVQRAQSITSQRSDGLNTPSSDANNAAAASSSNNHAEAFSGKKIYEIYYSPVVESILRPLFFASIGFAIPITKMFTGRVIWRGLVYTILMLFAKVICGLWLVRFAPMPRGKAIAKALAAVHSLTFGSFGSANTKDETTFVRDRGEAINVPRSPSSLQNNSLSRGSAVMELDQTTANNTQPVPDTRILANTTRKRTALPKPKSLYPAAILGSAMVARGEIGFLISSVAESNGVFGEGENTEEFLVVTWAILLCTLIGPITVGLLVKRVRRLQQTERKKAVGQEDPLGIWGVSPPSATP